MKMEIKNKGLEAIKRTIAKLKIKDIDQYRSYSHKGIIINDVLMDNETKIVTKYYDLIFKIKLNLKDKKC